MTRVWARWLAPIDAYVGWVVPAMLAGARLCKRFDPNVIIVTVPCFSALLPALAMTRGDRHLVIDYRDEWTNNRKFSNRLMAMIYRRIERTAIKRTSAVVVCTDNMRRDFVEDFADIKPEIVETIHNGFDYDDSAPRFSFDNGKKNMLYAGTLYGNRRLSMIAPVLVELRRIGFLSAESFCLHLYARLDREERESIDSFAISDLIEVHERVSYETIKEVMKASDVLYLPSGDEVDYAVPFKFYDYLSVRRPILAVASKRSAVWQMMEQVDCGECAEFGNSEDISSAVKRLLGGARKYTFDGGSQFLWDEAAKSYESLIRRVAELGKKTHAQEGR